MFETMSCTRCTGIYCKIRAYYAGGAYYNAARTEYYEGKKSRINGLELDHSVH